MEFLTPRYKEATFQKSITDNLSLSTQHQARSHYLYQDESPTAVSTPDDEDYVSTPQAPHAAKPVVSGYTETILVAEPEVSGYTGPPQSFESGVSGNTGTQHAAEDEFRGYTETAHSADTMETQEHFMQLNL